MWWWLGEEQKVIGFLYLEYDPFSHFVVYLGGKKYLDF